MTQYITDIDVSLNKTEEMQLREKGFIQNPVNLNKEAIGEKIFLWYKKGSGNAITRIQLTFNEEMSEGLKHANYHRVNKNLNDGTGGDKIHLWYYTGLTEFDFPIVDLFISTERDDEAQLFQFGWEKLACNMNRQNGGCRIYLWVKREITTYVRDITVTSNFTEDANLFKSGYIRVDEDTNRGAGGAWVFIWYRLTTREGEAIKDLNVCEPIVNLEKSGQNKKWIRLNISLNEGTSGTPLFICYLEGTDTKPIKTLSLIIKKIGVSSYQRAGVNVIDRNLNEGNEGVREYLCFYK